MMKKVEKLIKTYAGMFANKKQPDTENLPDNDNNRPVEN